MRQFIRAFLIFAAVACGSDSTSPSASLDGNWQAQVVSGATTYTVTLRLLPYNNGLYSGFGEITPSLNGGTSTAYLDVSALPYKTDSVSIAFSGGGPFVLFQGQASGGTSMHGAFSGALSGTSTISKQ